MIVMTHVVVAAAEPSGDFLAARLMREIKQTRPGISFSGIGGANMQAEGCECVADIGALSVMGYADAIIKLPRILPARAKLLAEIRKRKPALYVGVDAPDFNLSVANYARKRGAKTAQYGSPTIWMWRRERIKKISAAAEQVWCMLPFEPQCYNNAPIKAKFVGHPLANMRQQNRDDARKQLNIGGEGEVIAVLPGSRAQELKQHLPLAAQIINKLKDENDKRTFVTAAANSENKKQLQQSLPECVIADSAAQAFAAADIAAVKSGTVALEAALAGVPMVVFYLPSQLAEWTAKWRRFYLPFFSLPNILAGKFVAAEFIGRNEANAENIAAQINKLSREPQRQSEMRAAFAGIRQSLHSETGAHNAALAMLDG